MNIFRRTLLKATAASGLAFVMLTAGLLRIGQVRAAERNRSAFEAKSLDEALRAMGASAATASADLQIIAQDMTENGALVPVQIISHIPDTRSISILVEMNPAPLAASVDFANGAIPEISARLKLAQTSIVKAIAKANGQFYMVQKEIRVTLSGCED